MYEATTREKKNVLSHRNLCEAASNQDELLGWRCSAAALNFTGDMPQKGGTAGNSRGNTPEDPFSRWGGSYGKPPAGPTQQDYGYQKSAWHRPCFGSWDIRRYLRKKILIEHGRIYRWEKRGERNTEETQHEPLVCPASIFLRGRGRERAVTDIDWEEEIISRFCLLEKRNNLTS